MHGQTDGLGSYLEQEAEAQGSAKTECRLWNSYTEWKGEQEKWVKDSANKGGWKRHGETGKCCKCCHVSHEGDSGRKRLKFGSNSVETKEEVTQKIRSDIQLRGQYEKRLFLNLSGVMGTQARFQKIRARGPWVNTEEVMTPGTHLLTEVWSPRKPSLNSPVPDSALLPSMWKMVSQCTCSSVGRKKQHILVRPPRGRGCLPS